MNWVVKTILAPVVCLALVTTAEARNPWDINHGMSNPPQNPATMPGGVYSNQMKAFTPEFFRQFARRRLPVGTVLTAILENDISSNKSKAGDTFALTLQEGCAVNGYMVIPPNSRIIGSINSATPAKQLRAGNPGRVSISLQALVFPDGRHVPIYAQIATNPNMLKKKKPAVRNLGPDIKDFGQQVESMGLSFMRGPGFMMAKLNRGPEFRVDKGEVVSVKLTQALSVPELGPVLPPPLHPLMQAAQGPTIPYPPGTANMTPALIDPAGPIHLPVISPATASGAYAPVVQQPVPHDPNSVFSQPLQQQSSLPDPF